MEERAAAASFRLSSEVVTKLAKEPLGQMTHLLAADSGDARILRRFRKNCGRNGINNSRNTFEAGKLSRLSIIAREQFNNGLSQAEMMWRELAEKDEWIIKVKDAHGNETEQKFVLSDALKAEASARLVDVLKTRALVTELFKTQASGVAEVNAGRNPYFRPDRFRPYRYC